MFINKRYLSDLPFFQCDDLFFRVKLELRRAGDFFQHIRCCIEVRQENHAVLRDVFAHNTAILAADTNRHAVYGIAAFIRFQDPQSWFRGIFKSHIGSLVWNKLHRHWGIVGDVSGRWFHLLNDDGRYIQILQKDDAVVVRHTGVYRARAGNRERKFCAHDRLSSVRVHLAQQQSGLLVVSDSDSGYIIFQLYRLRLRIEDISGRRFLFRDYPCGARFHVPEGQAACPINLIDPLSASTVAVSEQIALRRFDLKNHAGDKIICLAVPLLYDKLLFQSIRQAQFVGFAGL